MADSRKLTAKEKRLKFRAVWRALKGLEDEWKSQIKRSKKMQRKLAIEKVAEIRRLITKEFRTKPKTEAQ
jgi:hypothetical protein